MVETPAGYIHHTAREAGGEVPLTGHPFPAMNPLTFKGIRSTTFGNVAVFEDFSREFVLDEESLEERISNLERTLDVSTERIALAALIQRNFADKLSTIFSSPAQ